MKLKYEMVLQQVGNQWFAVAVGDDARKCNKMVNLNETAHRIMELLQADRTMEELEEAILAEYEGDEQQIRESVRQFVGQLKEEGLV